MATKFLSLVLAGLLAGCASTAESLRTLPVTHYPAQTQLKVPDSLGQYLVLRCMENHSTAFIKESAAEECLYVSADVTGLLQRIDQVESDTAMRDRTINFLVSLSDMNCSNFLHRAFATKAGLDFSKTLLSDIATGVSAGVVTASPALAAGLNVSNLVGGKGVDAFNATYYYDKTFQAMESAIAAERLRIRTQMVGKQADQSQPAYDILQALSDIRAYDDACSIKAGLAQLVQLADSKKNQEQANKFQVDVAPNKASEARRVILNTRPDTTGGVPGNAAPGSQR